MLVDWIVVVFVKLTVRWVVTMRAMYTGVGIDCSGEGEKTTTLHEPLGGGLSTTPPSIGFVEKSIVE